MDSVGSVASEQHEYCMYVLEPLLLQKRVHEYMTRRPLH